MRGYCYDCSRWDWQCACDSMTANDNNHQPQCLDTLARVLDTVLLADHDRAVLERMYEEMIDQRNRRAA